ncbi:DUF1876 domain-containing protein [Dactylosporangium aurantiacum]|uniref:DUF1876 domain-containing protein n=1 Tax=Dactylosporangium aurantiacum TaxID=35754 RepID=A0A9Q9IAA3_9ACTN|nr:DUF1876 domain-containing protein [Dactylosporangium aurantiacum]MDG6101391.1 DUF1876 domain-containing protein [Dactylosporangium aurantiacum]UWZ52754.1 DUF1876 domain-containing protein [Dactylosporangium aurantiacum]
MVTTKHWNVDVSIGEDDGRTYAEARLEAGDATQLRGYGEARLNPADEDVPEIGDELAVARALSDLGHRVLVAAATDIQATSGEPVHLAG